MRLLRATRLVLSFWFGANPTRALAVSCAVPMQQLSGVLGAGMASLLGAAAIGHRPVLAIEAMLLGAAWVLADRGLGAFVGGRRAVLAQEIRHHAEVQTISRVADIPGLRHLEQPELLDRLQLLEQDCGAMAAGFWWVTSLAGFLLELAVIATVLARIDLLLLLLPLFAFPSLVATVLAQAVRNAAEIASAGQARLRDHLAEIALSPSGGREARLFGSGSDLLLRIEGLARAVRKRLDLADGQAAAMQIGGWIILGIGYLGALILVTQQALLGRVGAGQLLFTLIAAQQIQGAVVKSVGLVQRVQGIIRSALRIEWFDTYAQQARPVIRNPAPIPGRLARGIELEDVCFRYPGTDRTVLDHVSIHLPAGSVVALVGENGAGKTSLVKLLGHFYEPEAGRILVDGIDLQRLDPEAWRCRLTAGFQDYARLELLARESVGTGDLRRIDDDGFIRGAVSRGGAGNVIDSLPAGLQTQLGGTWEGGVELSAGQWQRVALARTQMRDVPLLQILDEPTSSLDPRAENELFERLVEAARRDRGQSQITILVSHRFSTVRAADLIVVIDGGRVREVGSHRELMAKGGLYAELYTIQATSYR